jgi:hypothetical protein
MFQIYYPKIKLIYAQRSYVDKANSYSTTETLTGGTWIDGKPIYRKVTSYTSVSGSGGFTGLYGILENLTNDVKGWVTIGTNKYPISCDGINILGNATAKYSFRFRFLNDGVLEWNFMQTDTLGVTTTLPVDSLVLILEYTKTTD